MRSRLLSLLFLSACGRDLSSSLEMPAALVRVVDAGTSSDAGGAVTPEAQIHLIEAVTVSPAGGAVTYEAQIQPLLYGKCSRCHESGNRGLPSFGDRYAVMLEPSTWLCPGQRIGDCVKRAVQTQLPSGDRCITILVRRTHVESWVCLSQDEIDLVSRWVDDGMPVR